MDRSRIIAKEISWLVPKLLRGLRAGFIGSGKITTSQMVTLMRIHERKTTRVGVLSREMQISAPTITGVVDRLLRGGYLKRIRDRVDRRVVNVELTSKGENLVKEMLSEINNRWYGILRQLSEEERESYIRILRKITQLLNKKNE